MNKSINIRKAVIGDEEILAYIQIESWKAAFKEIVPADILSECTEIESAIEMYQKILTENRGNGYILEVNENPHCIAWWDAAREEDMIEFAELICIHSLKDNWHKGYGKMMMEQIFADIKNAGYTKMMLWVFDSNVRAIKFYETLGFAASGKKKPAFGAVEEMYTKAL